MVKIRLKRIGVLNMALFSGLWGVFVGFLVAIIIILLGLIITSSLSASLGGNLVGFFDVGILSLIVFPLFYGVGGFIVALILTPLINLILRIIKGLDWEVLEEEEITKEHSPKPTQEHSNPQHPKHPKP